MTDVMQYIDESNQQVAYSLKVEHLGVVSSFIDQTELVQFVDTLLPKDREHNITNGEAFKFLTLSSFTQYRRSLYSLAQHMSMTPLFLFFNKNINIIDLNDDLLGRFLEAIDDYGPSAFFLRIVQYLAPKLPHLLNFDRLHADITNFTVFGQYKYTNDEDISEELIKIVHGHPKDKRSHLKCLSLALICNSKGCPVFMKPLSGNCSDNKELNLLIRNFFGSIEKTINHESPPLFIADAAFYSKDNIADFPAEFITRVPETLSEARNLIFKDIKMNIM
jgi:transposase